jgi:hypothetical protein
MPNQKKRHHYIPIAYLSAFADEKGKVVAYDKDSVDKPLHLKPDNIAFEKYCYSQLLPDGSRDNNTLEDFFSTYEAHWPGLVKRLSSRATVPSDFDALLTFITLTRVRVPAMRDMIEISRAEAVKLTAKVLDKKGTMPPKPEGLENVIDHLVVSIDPHESLLAIPALSQGFEKLLHCLEFEVLHNLTDVNILTSDNPVIVFNPRVPEAQVQPYQVKPPYGPVELIFPVTPHLAIRGRTGWFSLVHNVLIDTRPVERINRFVSRFGYRFVFSTDRSQDAVVAAHSATSAVARFTSRLGPTGRGMLFSDWVFGSRPLKPKWETSKFQNLATPTI